MSTRENVHLQLLEACRRGELATIQKLIESNAVNPNTVVDKRSRHQVNIGDGVYYYTEGWTPLHYSCV